MADSVIVIKLGGRDQSLSRTRNQFHLRSDGHHHWGAVARLDGPATRAGWSHPADVTVFLHAKVDSLPPLVVLIVVIASCVEQKVPADAAHIAQQRCGD